MRHVEIVDNNISEPLHKLRQDGSILITILGGGIFSMTITYVEPRVECQGRNNSRMYYETLQQGLITFS